MNISKLLSGVVFLALTTTSVMAAGGHEHANKPMYGGILSSVNDVDYELVAKADSLTLYVVNHGKPVTVAGAKASATVYAGSNKTIIALEPSGENTLVGKGSVKSGVGVRVAVVLTLPGKPETKVNFRLK